jgi:formate hydrogenlyase subunit 3/multisubunit Na+/H+ antiporter MnhD subunit
LQFQPFVGAIHELSLQEIGETVDLHIIKLHIPILYFQSLMDLSFKDIIVLLHPAIAILVLFPLLGIVVNRAILVRHRRQDSQSKGTSNIPPNVGIEHVKLGKYLATVVVGIALLGMFRSIFTQLATADTWHKNPLQAGSIVLMYGGTIATFASIDRAKQRH